MALPGLAVVVNRVDYVPGLDAPSDRPHSFVYSITIRNGSDRQVTIRGRKWIVTEADGHRVVVEGDGVVGQFPELAPGSSFEYNSRHIIKGPWAVAEGSYFGIDAKGHRVYVPIPPFRMELDGLC